MKKLHPVIILAAFFAAFVSTASAADSKFKVITEKPMGMNRGSLVPTSKGVVIEQSKGVPPYWELAGIKIYDDGSRDAMLKTAGSAELRSIPVADFAVVPPFGQRFKLAQIDGAGKFLPVDLVNIDDKLRWIIVD